jgi:hypothetical protein
VEETGGPGENHRPVASHWQTLSHQVVYLALIEIRTHNIRHIFGAPALGGTIVGAVGQLGPNGALQV